MEPLVCERRGAALLVGFNRPEKPNANDVATTESHRWPTISVVDGPAHGGGCELAMACDFRVASSRARFAQPELNLGILAGAGANWRLAQLVGLAQARRMLYLGETLDAGAARAAGLVDAVHEPEAVLDASDDKRQRMEAFLNRRKP
jgi:enoyl-CoA hydratase/carnithine racemase